MGLAARVNRLAHSHFVHRCKQAASEWAWRLGSSHEVLSGEAARVVDDLRRDGISISTMEALGFAREDSSGLLAESKRIRDEAIEQGLTRRSGIGEVKDFFFQLLGDRPFHVQEADVFARCALNPVILQIANAYLECYSWLMAYNIWLNLASSDKPKTSQLWHRDVPTFRSRCLKLFYVIEPVTDENGAFQYIPGSQLGGRHEDLDPEIFLENGNAPRVLDSEMERVVPREHWFQPVGSPGTVIFADTYGYHKGGHVKVGQRLLFNVMYSNWVAPYGVKVRFPRKRQPEFHKSSAARWASSYHIMA